ncbi:MAG: hypothetical protein A2176_01770 [Spirochaetes bacterium RBG_13_51_14]|nr:MAG: hypothetical protein A2176_01770 [Spirochaetes bacterium RBG_13_51_14]
MMDTAAHERAFNKNIRDRLNSDEWSFQVARGVMRHRRKRFAVAAVGSTATAAAAASLVIALLYWFQAGSTDGERLNRFVNAQVVGTWKKVFTDSSLPGENDTILVDAQYDESLDSMIEATLLQRL